MSDPKILTGKNFIIPIFIIAAIVISWKVSLILGLVTLALGFFFSVFTPKEESSDSESAINIGDWLFNGMLLCVVLLVGWLFVKTANAWFPEETGSITYVPLWDRATASGAQEVTISQSGTYRISCDGDLRGQSYKKGVPSRTYRMDCELGIGRYGSITIRSDILRRMPFANQQWQGRLFVTVGNDRYFVGEKFEVEKGDKVYINTNFIQSESGFRDISGNSNITFLKDRF